MLKTKRLDERAILPTVAHPGEDLAYDLYALEDVVFTTGKPVKVRTGIAAQAYHPVIADPLGLLIRDRSSMAARGFMVSGGVIDAGYEGEIVVLMTYTVSSYSYNWAAPLFEPILRVLCAVLKVAGYALGYDSFGAESLAKAHTQINAGDKIAQMIPIPRLTGVVEEVSELRSSARGAGGFGSSGK